MQSRPVQRSITEADQLRRTHTLFLQSIEFGEERWHVDDDAVADDPSAFRVHETCCYVRNPVGKDLEEWTHR